MEYFQNFFLDLLDKSDVPQKEAIYSLVKQFEKSNSKEHISSLEELDNSQVFEDILFVDLSEETLHEFPSNLLKCKNLKSLDLSSTFINSIEGIGMFKDLELLLLDECEELKSISSEIGELKKLKGIEISNTSIQSLSKEFFTLKNIVYCRFNENELSNAILFELEQFENLVELHLDSNEMLNENGDTLSFKNLIKVDLSNNNFEILPLDFSACKLLEELNISNNPIQKLPDSFLNLQKLKELNISECLIGNIPNLSTLISCEKLTLGHYDMKNIPIEIFSIPNLTVLEIENSDVKYIPEKLGLLSKLEHLNISDSRIKTLPNSIGKLQNLAELELRDNYINHLPPELGSLKNLTYLSLSNWNEGNNKLKELPPWIGQLQSLNQLGLDNLSIEKLPKEIGNLTNLSSLDLSNNPLSRLPLEFANLRKLKSLNLFDCPLGEMPEVQDMGIDELFEYLNKLRGVGRYSFNWELPESLQTAFQQYLNFFSDYIKKFKGFDVGLSVLKTELGLKLETEATNDLSIENIGEYLNEYLVYIKENVDFSSVDKNENPNMELLRIQMEAQINHFKQQLRQAEFENKYLRKSVDKLLDAHVNFSHAFSKQKLSLPENSMQFTSNKEFEKIKTLIVKNNFDKAFNDLSLLIKEDYPERLNEVLVLNSRMTNVKFEARIGSIGFEQKQMEMNKVASSLLEFLQSL